MSCDVGGGVVGRFVAVVWRIGGNYRALYGVDGSFATSGNEAVGSY